MGVSGGPEHNKKQTNNRTGSGQQAESHEVGDGTLTTMGAVAMTCYYLENLLVG